MGSIKIDTTVLETQISNLQNVVSNTNYQIGAVQAHIGSIPQGYEMRDMVTNIRNILDISRSTQADLEYLKNEVRSLKDEVMILQGEVDETV